MVCYADADHAGDLETRKSTTGFIVMYAGGPVIWKSKRQGCITISTYESELVALSHAVSEVDRVIGILTDIGDKDLKPVRIYCDNQAACIAANVDYVKPVTSRTVETRRFHVREQVQNGTIDVRRIKGEENLADMFTKSLPAEPFCRFKKVIMK